jgi:AAA ATPase domain/NYN domain
MRIGELRRVLRQSGVLGEAGGEPAPAELADALWLAALRRLGGAAPPSAEDGQVLETAPGSVTEQPPGRTEPEPGSAPLPSPPLYATLPARGRASPGVLVAADSGPQLREVLPLARAMRPLRRRVPSASRQVIDEERTADLRAEHRLWLPALVPESEPAFDLALVLDTSESMALWGEEQVREFQLLCERIGAFRDVRLWRLGVGGDGTRARPVLRGSWRSSRTYGERELIDPSGRRLILVITDGVHPWWRSSGPLPPVLARWALASPLAIVQPFPRRLWDRTPLRPVRLEFRPGWPGSGPTLIRRARNGPASGNSGLESVAVPILELSPAAIGRWAELISGTSGVTLLPAAILPRTAVARDEPSSGQAGNDQSRRDQADPEQAVREFRASVSPAAYQLAGYLSAAAPLTLPVMRLVQESMMSGTGPAELAEVYLSGLLRRSAGADLQADYVFAPGVRDVLQSMLTRTEALSVLDQVGSYLIRGRRGGRPFPVLLQAQPDGGDIPAAAGQFPASFGRISGLLRERIGGPSAGAVREPASLEEPAPGLPQRTRVHPLAHSPLEPVADPQQPEFVGRQEEISRYRANLLLPTDDPERRFLFNIHGVAGVGKTFLTRQLQRTASEAGALTAYVDYAAEDLVSVMNTIAGQLARDGGKPSPFETRAGQHRRELDSDPMLAAALEEVLLAAVEELSPVFAAELCRAAANRPVALFFDDYQLSATYVDQWLRDLLNGRYGDLPDTLIVTISGQEPLDAGRWSDYLPVLGSMPLNPFSETETRQFLARKNLTREALVEVVLKLSGGLPLLLAMLADNLPQEVADIADPAWDAIERFLQWEDPARRALALAAALPRVLSEDVVGVLVPDGSAGELYAWLRGLPFVSEQRGSLVYHEVVRTGMLRLQRTKAPAEWRARHESLAEANARWADAAVAGTGGDIRGNAVWAGGYASEETYHRLCADPDGYQVWALHQAGRAAWSSVPRARQWAEILADAGRDTASDQLIAWGRRLTDSLRDGGLAAYMACLASDPRLDPGAPSVFPEATATRQRRRFPERTLWIVDIENLAGTAIPGRHQVQQVKDWYDEYLEFGPDDQVVIAANHMGSIAGPGWPKARYLVSSPEDGVERELLDILQNENADARFERVVIGSGDETFTAAAERLAARGVKVTVVGHRNAIADGLLRAASDVIFIGDTPDPAVRKVSPKSPLAEGAAPPEHRTRRRNSVPTIVDAGRIADGTPVTFKTKSARERALVDPWLAKDPRRSQATWVNHRSRPLLWAYDGQRYSPTGLVTKIWSLSGWPDPPTAVQGTLQWHVAGQGSLADIARAVEEGRESPEEQIRSFADDSQEEP